VGRERNYKKENDEYAGQFNYGQAKGKGKGWIQSINVTKPAYRSKIEGTTKIAFKAPGMEFAEAKCWQQPDKEHPGAKGLKLIFADDFDKMPSISRFGVGATYMGHKPPNGSQDFSGWRFSQKDGYPGAHDPYEQMGTWLRIKARAEGKDKKKWGTGIFAPVDINYNGVATPPPFYFECRFTA